MKLMGHLSLFNLSLKVEYNKQPKYLQKNALGKIGKNSKV